MQHLTDYYILYLLLICRIFLKYGTGNVMNNNKEKSTEKIDGAIATIMALDRAIRCGNEVAESVYDTRGLLVF